MRVLQMASGDWIAGHEHGLVLGNRGTGKTHLALALERAAVEAGYRVRFTTALALGQDARSAGRPSLARTVQVLLTLPIGDYR